MGFKIADKAVYISDVSHIPEDVWSSLLTPSSSEETRPVPLLVLDCLRVTPHTSHFGLKQAVETVRRLGARRSYLVGFTHDLTHEAFSEILQIVSGKVQGSEVSSKAVQDAINMIKGDGSYWVQPAHDGLRLVVTPDGNVREVDSSPSCR